MINILSLRQSRDKGSLSTKFYPSANVETIDNVLLDTDGILSSLQLNYRMNNFYNLFYTLAHHNGEGLRDHTSFDYQNVIPIDVDSVLELEIERYVELIGEVTGTDPKKCGVVYSGNGIHYLIKVDPFNLTTLNNRKPWYSKLIKNVQEMLIAHALPCKVDPVLDAARIFRLPGTENRKPMSDPHGADAIVKHCRVANGIMANYEGMLGWSTGIPMKEAPRGETPLPAATPHYPAPDVEYIVQECPFLAAQLESGGASASEPVWFAALSLAAWMEDGNVTAHAISKGHPDYTYEATEKKTEQCLKATGPRSCESISQVHDCQSCKWWGKIKGPLQLKRNLSRDPAPSAGASSEPQAENWDKWIKDGFTEYLVDKKGKPRMVRRYDKLREYYDHLHPYIRLHHLERTMIFVDGYYQKTSHEAVKNFANRYFQPRVDKVSERNEFWDSIKTHNITENSFILDGNAGFVNLLNGVLDINTGILHKHDPKRGFTHILPYNYVENATSPTWDLMLYNLTMGRKNLANTIEEFLGYCVYGGPYNLAKALILSGDGENGKSTMLNAFRMVLGDNNVSSIPISKMSSTFTAAGLEGKLANFSEEEPPSCFKETSYFKRITGDTPIRVEHKYESGFDLLNRAKMVMTYNTMPFLGDISGGMRRRLLIIPFDCNLLKHPDKCIPDVKKKLNSELSGILNRALEGWRRLSARGRFLELDETQEILKEMVKDSDHVILWAETCVEITGNQEDHVFSEDLFKAYFDYSLDSGLKKLSFAHKFKNWAKGKEGIVKCDINKDGKGLSGYRGIKLPQDRASL